MDRRDFLKTGMLGSGLVVVPAILTSCDIVDSKSSDSDVNKNSDIALLRTAAEMENVAIATYNAAAGLLSAGTLSVAVAFRDHHTVHFDELNKALAALGASKVVYDVNKAPDSRTGSVTNEVSALQLAATLEMEASQSYFAASTGTVGTNIAKKILIEIMPVELLHYSALKSALSDPLNIKALYSNL